MDELREAIRKAVQARLTSATVTQVNLSRSYDVDGDPILLIRVVYESETNRLNGTEMLGMARHVKPYIEESSESDRLPIFSYVAAHELAAAQA